MIITHETTIEEYEAWLATNPSMTALRKVCRAVIKRACRLVRKIVATKTRSSLRGTIKCKTILPDDRHYGNYNQWRNLIIRSGVIVSRHVKRHELFESIADNRTTSTLYQQRHQRLSAKIKDELEMESLFESALTLIK